MRPLYLQTCRSDEAEQVAETGARGEFEASDLVDELDQIVEQMAETETKAGYRIIEGEQGFSWETEDEASEDFYDRAYAGASAYADCRKMRYVGINAHP